MSLLLLFRRWRSAVSSGRFVLAASAVPLRTLATRLLGAPIAARSSLAASAVSSVGPATHLGMGLTPAAVLTAGASRA